MQAQIPWQLYLFCSFQFFGFLLGMPWIRDPCHSFGGTCNSMEKFASISNAFLLLSLGVFFLVLTLRNRDKPERLKRLAYFAIYCTISNLTALLMIGASSVTGLMNTTEHILYVLVTLLLFFVLASVVSSDTPMVATARFREGLGFNLKGLFALLSVYTMLWIIVSSDLLSTKSSFVDKSGMTELARMCWNNFDVLYLQLLFVFIYALAYDDDGDRAVLGMAFALLLPLEVLTVWAYRKMLTSGTLLFVFINDLLLLLLALAAIARYQMDLRRGDYEPLISNA